MVVVGCFSFFVALAGLEYGEKIQGVLTISVIDSEVLEHFPGEKPASEEEAAAFNCGVLTTVRIDNLLKDISRCRVIGHIPGYRDNLRELLIEGQGCLFKEEFVKAWRDWRVLECLDCSYRDGIFLGDPGLLNRLDAFSAWLRLKLYRRGLTMPNRGSVDVGMIKIRKKYGL